MKVHGTQEVLRNLDAVHKHLDREIEAAVRETAERVQQHAKLNAPINKIGATDSVGGSRTQYFDSYHKAWVYRGRLKTSVESEKDDSKKHAYVVRAGGKPRKSNQTYSEVIYAAFVELGTRRMRARPFLRNALRAHVTFFNTRLRKVMTSLQRFAR